MLQARHGVVASVAGLAALWSVLLLSLPASVRAAAVPWVLFLDLAALGFFFVPALAVVERGNGVTAALRLTRLSPARALGVRVGLLSVWSVLAAMALVAAGRPHRPLLVVGGAAVTSLLLCLLAQVMVGRHTTLTGYLPRIPLVGVPLLVPALVHGIGVSDAPLLWLSPATGALALLGGHGSWLAAGWVGAWIVGGWVAATRIGFDVLPRPTTGTVASSRRTTRSRRTPMSAGPGWWRAVRAFARADRRTLLGDGVLVMLVAGIPLLALLVRLLAGPGLPWALDRWGLDLALHLPALWALVVVVHAPVMAGSLCGMLFLEDRDAGLLPAIATTRASLRTLVAYRLAATAAGTMIAVAVALLVAGAAHRAGTVGLVATAVVAAAVATVPAMVLAALVRDRVVGMAAMKAMSLPLYLPLAWWWVDGPAGWAFGLVPTGWAVRTFWASSAVEALGFAAGGVAVSGVLVVVLLRRLRGTTVA